MSLQEVDFGYDPLSIGHGRKVSYRLSIISPLEYCEQPAHSIVTQLSTETYSKASESPSSDEQKHAQLTSTVDTSTDEGQEEKEKEAHPNQSTKGNPPQPLHILGSDNAANDDGNLEIFQMSGYVSNPSGNDHETTQSINFAKEEFSDLDEGEDPLSLMEIAFSQSLTYDGTDSKPAVNSGYVQGVEGQESHARIPQPDSPHSSTGDYVTGTSSYPTELGPLMEEPEIVDIMYDDTPIITSTSPSSDEQKHAQLTSTVDMSTDEGQEEKEKEAQPNQSTKGNPPQPLHILGSDNAANDDGKLEIFQMSGYVSNPSGNDHETTQSINFVMEEFSDLDEGEDPLPLMEIAFSQSLTYDGTDSKPAVNSGYVQGVEGQESHARMPQPDSPHSSTGDYVTGANSYPMELGPLVEEPEIVDIMYDDAPTPTPLSAGYVSESQLPSDIPTSTVEDRSPDGYQVQDTLQEVPLSEPLSDTHLFTRTLETQSVPTTSHSPTDLNTSAGHYISSDGLTSSGYTSEAAMSTYQLSSHMPSTSPTCSSSYIPSSTTASSGYVSESATSTYQRSSPAPSSAHYSGASSGNYIPSSTSTSSGYVSECAMSTYQPTSPIPTTSYSTSSSGHNIPSSSSASGGYASESAMPTYQSSSPVPTSSYYSSYISNSTSASSGYVSEASTYQPSSPISSSSSGNHIPSNTSASSCYAVDTAYQSSSDMPSSTSCSNYVSSNISASSGYVSQSAMSACQPNSTTSSVELNIPQTPYGRDSPTKACWSIETDSAPTYISTAEVPKIPSGQPEANSMSQDSRTQSVVGHDASASICPSIDSEHQPRNAESESTPMGQDDTGYVPIEDHLLQEDSLSMLSEMPVFMEHSETQQPQRWGFNDAGYIDGDQQTFLQPTALPTVNSSKQLTTDSGNAISFQLNLDSLEQCDNGSCIPSTPASADTPLGSHVPHFSDAAQYTISHYGYVQSH